MSKGKKASLGCLFWIALFLVVVVIFLYNQENLAEVISLFQKPAASENHEPATVTRTVDDRNTRDTSRREGDGTVTVTMDPRNQDESANPAPSNAPAATPKPGASPNPVIQPTPIPGGSYRASKIYFVDARNPESLTLKSVIRTVNFKDTPLTETLSALITGPTAEETRTSLTSLIPKGTKINSISVKNGVAYINFNDEFRFNNMGLPGLNAQLKQIVFTTTEFSNITQVQILINGKKVNYLAQEGIFVGEPLSRSSF
ncbi:MAG: hypothetical protein EHM28_10235 [Spirochaetaceae bacterium]|nr:MAG: hypothetical protein EHM28_10235 [Spirochaetaceae bacterium]